LVVWLGLVLFVCLFFVLSYCDQVDSSHSLGYIAGGGVIPHIHRSLVRGSSIPDNEEETDSESPAKATANNTNTNANFEFSFGSSPAGGFQF
jgi:hypothetical protein